MLRELPSARVPRVAHRWVATTSLAYALAGELLFQDDRPVTLPDGMCLANPGSYLPTMALWLAVVFTVSTAVLLRRTAAGRRLWSTTAHAGGAAALGIVLAEVYYLVRMALAPPCPGIEFCADCTTRLWPYVAPVVGVSALAAVLAAIAGALVLRARPVHAG